ncbi:tRNA uridine-5-carboxymethylaminomethyl(34) synthesis enzyme MnmG [Lactobacillus panisapium]|uniref:tRNA uridine 5-carboxymethylaminomethyl modification enzyme MnmG n=1 Tax=Lactobacillus panisapium TaxID=2012495 RepID=A0ABX8WFA5_9LACO|nr:MULTISPECIES: tRNA uridine-5-carboxymethylaminomethyl(34) synthesis enzyme MnmG [Lactobacillus]MCO6531475.1 tRNA uridine-5-carboxymethylaminomethyl(34) synthesis enzyme MnmG [Lactobacillus sp.]MCT6854023.1 tRNA uridine-5-carboxymethylaminomethyl(34) synthesis enzyme MnmG [Lactobacillus panisapium]MCX8724990.1 tRNA uridine-5-carboxymethylaminomethyl(34) synthesis enzyme MnmG [Lactobacillus sp. B4007]QYN53776.1 tRNA uridine-5-carboxymethylaminomethyl(34) synthesis enzyme MnmG [Lactobacillus pa
MIKNYDSNDYDVIVVGAGHAGSEAALASARMGQKTLLLTISLDMVAFMPCNPSVGGPAKGTVVREIDALGGQMGKNIDATYIQMRMLNTGKGPAVQALRAQADKWQYHEQMKSVIEETPNLTLRQATVDELIVEDGVCKGLITNTGARYHAKSVVLTTGTSARGRIYIGELNYSSGPNNTIPAIKLSENLEKLGFKLRRFKTGTPPRVNSNTIDYSKTEEEPGDQIPRHFSFESKDEDYLKEQVSCWMTYTNKRTHKIINENLTRSPMFSGEIKGVGPRYCPSIETKVVRFADKPRHQIFLEPEGKNTKEVYVGDFSTSMPEEIQLKMLHTVAGLEDAELMRPGYAIEYDVIDPWQLKHTLETKNIKNLFTAGQMNGTSGYEEAAGQGLIAGINAALRASNRPGFTLGRDEAYIGVLIDDLVTKGTEEPYRLLTSRAEYRLILRHDNADLRLTDYGYQLGLISEERYSKFLAKKEQIKQAENAVKTITIHPDEKVQAYLASIGEDKLKAGVKADVFLRRPRVKVDDIEKLTGETISTERYVKEQIEINVKYAGYIKKEQQQINRLHRQEAKKIPADIDYQAIEGLATEAREKFEKIRPETIAQAERISGVNPADMAILSVYVQNGRYAKIKK